MNSLPPPSSGRISALRLAAYSTLAFPLAAGVLALQIFVPTFYAESLGLSLSSVGLILLLARLWDTVSDPVIGVLSDITPISLGRRRLWVLCGTPLLILSAWMLFNPAGPVTIWYLLIWTVAIYLAGTMIIVPYYAWGAELTPDYHERSRISGGRVFTGLAATLITLGLPVLLGGDANTLGPTLRGVIWLMAGTLLLAVLAIILFVPDRPQVPQASVSLAKALRLFRRRTPLRQLLAAYLVNGIANAIPATLFLLYTTHKLDGGDRSGLWLFTYFACAAVSTPFWVWLAGRMGKDRTWRRAVIFACLTFVWTPFLGPDDHLIYLVIVILGGFAAGADLVLPIALQADLVDWDAARTGKARPGIFFAIWGTTTKLGFALAVGIAFPLLDLIGFRTDGSNTGAALAGLGIIYGLVPVLLKLIALWIMQGYPITRAVHDGIQRRLHARGIAWSAP